MLVGVGLGKICVFIYCIVWLIGVENVFELNILVVIFINKVVSEMCYCIESMFF